MNRYLIFIMIGLLQACTTVPEQPPVVKPTLQQKTAQPIAQKPIIATKPAEPKPLPSIRGFRQQTYATWYKPTEHGNPTTSGDTYDYYAMTAAHDNLPLGSQVRVRHVSSGRSIIITINDRHPPPFIKLSIFAAKKLGVWEKSDQIVMIEGLNVKRIR